MTKLWYFTNLDFPETFADFPFLRHLLGAHVVWGRYKGHPSPNLSNFWWCQGASSLPRKWFRGNSTVTWRFKRSQPSHHLLSHTQNIKHIENIINTLNSNKLSQVHSHCHDKITVLQPMILTYEFSPQDQDTVLRCCFRRFRLRSSRRFRWFRFLHVFVLLDEFQHLQGTTLLPSEMPSRVFSSNIVFVGTRCARLFIFPPFRRMGGHTWHVACFCCLTVFRWIWSRLAEEWCRFFLVVSSQVVFFLVLDLNHQILHWNTPCFTNIRIASSIWMNPSLCVSPSCNIFATRPWPNNMNLRVVKSI